jgi:hypothetical protein
MAAVGELRGILKLHSWMLALLVAGCGAPGWLVVVLYDLARCLTTFDVRQKRGL